MLSKQIILGSMLLCLGTVIATAENLAPNGDLDDVRMTRSTQTLPNGGFESGALAPWYYEKSRQHPNPGVIQDQVVGNGAKAFKMHRADNRNNALLYPNITIAPKTTYELSFMLKCDQAPKHDLTVKMLCFGTKPNGKSGVLNWATKPPNSGVFALYKAGGTVDWKTVKITLSPECFKPGTKSAVLFFERKNNSAGAVYIDAVEFKASATTAKKKSTEKPVNKPISKPNLLPGDTSFEASTMSWTGQRSEAAAYQGTAALLVPVGQIGATSKLYYNVIQENKPYTLSFYVKSDSPIHLNIYAWHLRWKTMGHRRLKTSSKWQRVVVPIAPQNRKHGLKITIRKLSGKGNLYIDAVQLNAGRRAAVYAPSEKFVSGILTSGEPGEVFFPGPQPVKYNYVLRSDFDQPIRVQISAETEDYRRQKNLVYAQEVVIPPGTTKKFSLHATKHRKTGYYVLQAQAKLASGKIYKAIQSFAVVNRPVDVGDQTMFGIHPFGMAKLEEQHRIGVGMVRNFRMWKYTKTDKSGNYLVPPSFAQRYHPYRMAMFECLKVTLAPKKYQRADGTLDLQEYQKFVEAYLHAYGKHVTYWEIENEPDLEFPKLFKGNLRAGAEYYAKVVNTIAPIIKRHNPNAVILGAGVSGVDSTKGFPFTRIVLEQAGKNIEIIPYHPYVHARYIGPENSDIGPDVGKMIDRTRELSKLIKKFGGNQRIWFGELGWALNVYEDPLSRSAMRHAAYLTRSMLLAKMLGVEKVLYFLSQGTIERNHYAYGLWRDKDFPLPAVSAYAAAKNILEGARFVTAVSNANIMNLMYLSRDREPFLAIWLASGTAITADLALPPAAIIIKNLFGNQLTPTVGPGNTSTIRLSGNPVFVYLRNRDQKQLLSVAKTMDYSIAPVDIVTLPAGLKSIKCIVTNKLPSVISGKLQVTLADVKLLNPKADKITLQPHRAMELHFAANRAVSNQVVEAKFIQNGKLRAQATRKIELETCAPHKSGRSTRFNLKTRDHIIPRDPGIGWDNAADLSIANARWSYDRNNLYFNATVTDDIHSQKYFPGQLWAGDSIQIAIDTHADAAHGVHKFDDNDYELTIGLTSKGPQAEVNYMHQRGRQKAFLQALQVKIIRTGKTTSYHLAIPWRQLRIKPVPDTIFGCNFIVNDNDGTGRQYWMGPTGGIGEMKHPYVYKKFILAE